MRWKTKARIQNTVSLLPSGVSNFVYYKIQRHLGGLKQFDPASRFRAATKIWSLIKSNRCDPVGKVFFEVGTGWAPAIPMAYWLMGAAKTTTVDLNRYLKRELIADTIKYIKSREMEIHEIFGAAINQDRLQTLMKVNTRSKFLDFEFMDMCGIHYIAPIDAANTELENESIDFHTSYTVFEHITPSALGKIIAEGNRITKQDGLFVNLVDYSDHFSHGDRSISKINFLQYSDTQWSQYAGNSFMYMNRLRHDDFTGLFESCGHRILSVETHTDHRSQMELTAMDFHLDRRFMTKPHDVLSVTSSWFVTQKQY